jgi:CO/xanthine dehydrogenase Mo-binding subunit
MEKTFCVIGKPFHRVEAREKATGEFQFVGDIPDLPNMLHAKILRSPYAHARVPRPRGSLVSKRSLPIRMSMGSL